MMLSGTPARFLVEVALHGQAVVPAAGKDHCHHPWGARETIAGSSWCPLAQNPLSLDPGRAAGYKLISNLLLRANFWRKL